jgi:hypothetical protein
MSITRFAPLANRMGFPTMTACDGPKLRHQTALASGISHRAQPQSERRAD